MLFFHKLPNIHFFKHFLQISHNLRIIKVQNNVSSDKTLSQNCSKQWEVEIYADKTIGQVTKVRTPRWLKKTAATNIALHLVLTKKSELNLNDKDVFPQADMSGLSYFAIQIQSYFF